MKKVQTTAQIITVKQNKKILKKENGRTLDENGGGARLLDVLDKSKLLLAQGVLVDQTRPSKDLGRQIVDRVLGNTSANQLHTLHVSSLGAAEGKDAILGQDIQRQGIDTLLVNDDKALLRVTADLSLQLDNLLQLLVHKLALRLDQLLSLLSRAVEESRVNLRLFVLQRHVEGENKGILDALGHIGVAGSVIHDQTTNQTGVGLAPVLHGHDLDHVQINGLVLAVDGQNGINNSLSQGIGQGAVDLGAEGSTGNRHQQLAIDLLLHSERVQELVYFEGRA